MSFINTRPAFLSPDGASESLQDRIEKINESMRSIDEQIKSIPSDSGVMHTYTPRKHLTFKANGNQQVDEHNGAYIVMGSDNPSHAGTGTGASGNTKSSTIDMVVGRGAGLNKGDGPGEGWFVGNMFSADAARIYISESTNIDKNFGIAAGAADAHSGKNDHPLSAIGIKADNVRMVARNNIKIVTGRNQGFTGQEKGLETNSLGGKSPQGGTISLIGGNYSDAETKYMGLYHPSGLFSSNPYLQPAIKGDNLIAALEAMYAYIDLVASACFNITLGAIGMDAAYFSDPFTSPVSKVPMIIESGLSIPFGLDHIYAARTKGLADRRRFLEYGGEFHIRSANVYLT